MEENAEKLAYKVKVVAQELDVTPGALYAAAKRGEVEMIEVGRAKRISARERRRLLKLDD